MQEAAIVSRPSLRRVINATGVIIHTNLGRAPLARVAVEAITSVASHYSNLEYDLATGERGNANHIARNCSPASQEAKRPS